MPTQRAGYYTKDGIKRPSVTTILGRFKESGGLIQWAYTKGREHQGMADRGLPAPQRLYDEVEEAADIGTLVHAMAEDRVQGRDPWARLNEAVNTSSLNEEAAAKAKNGYEAFERWLDQSRIEIIHTEQPMVSEAMKCGGTLDWIGRINGALVLGDFKTSKALYPEFLVQVAAYREMWNETHPDEALADGAHILRFGKAAGDFHHSFFPELEDGINCFRALRIAYDLDRKLKERV